MRLATASTRKRGRPQLVVLDMAGTTVAVADLVPEVWRVSFRHFGLEVSQVAIAGVRGRSKREAAAELLLSCGAAPELLEDIYQTFQHELNDRIQQGVAPMPGAGEAIRALRALAGRVVLITGFDRETTDRIVNALGWQAIADGVLCADDVADGRPAPDLILRAMSMTGVNDPARVLVAGDTSADLRAAANAHAGWIVGVLSGAHDRAQLEVHRHNILLQGVAELPAWLISELDGT